MMIIVQAFYYYKFNNLSTKKANEYFTNINQQLEKYIISNNNEIKKISDFISFNDTVQKYILSSEAIKRYQLSSDLYAILDTKLWVNDNVKHIHVIDLFGKAISLSSNDLYLVFNNIIKDYKLETADYRQGFFTDVYFDTLSKNYYYAYINPIFNKFKYSKNSLGKTIVIVDTSSLQTIIDNISISPQSLIVLIDNKNNIIASNDHSLRTKKMVEADSKLYFVSNDEEKEEYLFNQKKYLINSISFEELNWELRFLIPKSELTNDMIPIVNSGILITIVFVVVLIIFGIKIVSSIVSPISKITKQLDNIGDGNIKYRLDIKCNNEINIIIKDINFMLERIENMTKKIFHTQDKLYSLELDKKQAELSALQSQINPHFLYNTLECIRSIGMYHGIKEIHEISSSMAQIFRYAIKKQDIVTIKDELSCIYDYIRIMNIRFMGKFELEVIIPEEILNNRINKMVLQPIVENAIYHGLENIIGDGKIVILGHLDKHDECLIIEVSDNGQGIPDENLYELKKSLSFYSTQIFPANNKRSIGLLNINSRLRLSYGKNYGIEIESITDIGTTITLRLPNIS